jgi:hypothetical protein
LKCNDDLTVLFALIGMRRLLCSESYPPV